MNGKQLAFYYFHDYPGHTIIKNKRTIQMKQPPLAFRMRPSHVGEIIGQQHRVGENKIVHRMIQANRLAPMILFGPPGTGETSMAVALAKPLDLPVRTLSAVV